MWIDSNGNVTKETEVQLAGQVPDSPRAIAWHFLGIPPVAIAWLFVVAVALPFSMLQDHKATTFGDAISQSFEIAWPPLLVVFAIAAILAWITIRARRNYRRSATPAWAIFVLLLGVPGFIAYWLERRRPKLESCSACGTSYRVIAMPALRATPNSSAAAFGY